MEVWREIGRAQASNGALLQLRQRGGSFEIRCDGFELMANRAHYSEQALGRLGCSGLARRAAPRVLIGGLGMGYSLRAALDALPHRARVVVAEVFQQVVAWNRGPLGVLAGHPLADPRVTVVVADVASLLAPAAFAAILLDVDNGPEAVMLPGNAALYRQAGLRRLAGALGPRGRLGFWSADSAPRFEAALTGAGLHWWRRLVPARGVTGDPLHTLYFAKRRLAA
jgi:spermidine synthase